MKKLPNFFFRLDCPSEVVDVDFTISPFQGPSTCILSIYGLGFESNLGFRVTFG